VVLELPAPRKGSRGRALSAFLQLGAASVWALLAVQNYTKVDPRDPPRPAPEALLPVHFWGITLDGHGVGGARRQSGWRFFGPVFQGFSAENDPRDPPGSPGPAPHINFHEKPAPQTMVVLARTCGRVDGSGRGGPSGSLIRRILAQAFGCRAAASLVPAAQRILRRVHCSWRTRS